MESTRRCSVDECTRPHFGKGLCNTHYYRLRRNGTLALKTPAELAASRAQQSEVCAVDACERIAHRRVGGEHVCKMHARRFQRHGDFETVGRRWGAPGASRECSVDGCDRIEDGNAGLCKMHDTRRRRHGDPTVWVPPHKRKVPRGEASPHWTGDDASYSAMHQRVKKARGKARDHECACGAPAAHWSYQHGHPSERIGDTGNGTIAAYGTDIWAYRAMCVSCHKKYDLEVINESRVKKSV